MFRPVRQRLVRTHPVTGRKSLYLSSHAGAIVGMPMPEARILLRDLTEHATQPKFVYVHRWRVGDLVMWDNRQMMHRARRYDEQPAPRHAPHHGGRERADHRPGLDAARQAGPGKLEHGLSACRRAWRWPVPCPTPG